mmetsp:Transcript_11379/g.36157  ORF Transcript_11379/g.36157 Transcript_11379/m.36157 type:complete len:274 (-) Transcript_11379:2657-3478(-)
MGGTLAAVGPPTSASLSCWGVPTVRPAARAVRCTCTLVRVVSTAATALLVRRFPLALALRLPRSTTSWTRLPCPSTVTVLPTRGRSLRPSTWQRCGSCPPSLWSRTTSTPWARLSTGRRWRSGTTRVVPPSPFRACTLTAWTSLRLAWRCSTPEPSPSSRAPWSSKPRRTATLVTRSPTPASPTARATRFARCVSAATPLPTFAVASSTWNCRPRPNSRKLMRPPVPTSTRPWRRPRRARSRPCPSCLPTCTRDPTPSRTCTSVRCPRPSRVR